MKKEVRRKQGQTNEQTTKQSNKAKQHSTPKAVTIPPKNELPQMHAQVAECVSVAITVT